MIVKNIYVAFDGTEFYDEKECSNYEKKCKSEHLNIKIWDKNFKPLTGVIFEDIDDIHFFMAYDEESFSNFIDYMENECGYDMGELHDALKDEYTHLWMIDDDSWDCPWVDCTKEYERYKNFVETMTIG